MAFHVEVRRSFRSARAFNLGSEELQAKVIGPWLAGAAVELGGHEWLPADCQLTILDGPPLDPPSLAFGQGWTNARRSARDVTAELLASGVSAATQAAVALLAPAGPARERLSSLLDSLGLGVDAWEPLRAQILAAATGAAGRQAAPPGAAVVVIDDPDPAEGEALAREHRIDVGLAVGALGARAVLVSLAGRPPPVLTGIRVVDLGGAAVTQALAERLRLAGCAVSQQPGSAGN